MEEDSPEIKFAPREIFEQILEWSVIPTFDLVLEFDNQGIILLRRTIPPYQDVWALPGLRMFKPESIEDTLTRIAQAELGLSIIPSERVFLGQFVGYFQEEHNRQDLSTGFYLRVPDNQKPIFNQKHFSEQLFVNSWEEVPEDTGEMYKFYLQEFFRRRGAKEL